MWNTCLELDPQNLPNRPPQLIVFKLLWRALSCRGSLSPVLLKAFRHVWERLSKPNMGTYKEGTTWAPQHNLSPANPVRQWQERVLPKLLANLSEDWGGRNGGNCYLSWQLVLTFIPNCTLYLRVWEHIPSPWLCKIVTWGKGLCVKKPNRREVKQHGLPNQSSTR